MARMKFGYECLYCNRKFVKVFNDNLENVMVKCKCGNFLPKMSYVKSEKI